MKNIVVIYHSDCTDGFSSAWAAWKKFGNNADYIGIEPGSKPVTELKDKEIYMVDVIYPAQYLKKLVKENKKVVAIDHHFSNQKAFNLISDGLFDLNHSGAVLSWKYFHPQKEVPKFLNFVEDMDLWRFKMGNTKEVISYLDTIEFNFENWNKVSKDLENLETYKEYIKKGTLILNYQDILINRIIKEHAELVNFLSYKTYVVNSPLFNSQ